MRAELGGYHGGEYDDVTILITTVLVATVIIALTDAAHADKLLNIGAAESSAPDPVRSASAVYATKPATASVTTAASVAAGEPCTAPACAGPAVPMADTKAVAAAFSCAPAALAASSPTDCTATAGSKPTSVARAAFDTAASSEATI